MSGVEFKQVLAMATKPRPGDVVWDITGRWVVVDFVKNGEVFYRTDTGTLYRKSLEEWRQSMMRDYTGGLLKSVERGDGK